MFAIKKVNIVKINNFIRSSMVCAKNFPLGQQKRLKSDLYEPDYLIDKMYVCVCCAYVLIKDTSYLHSKFQPNPFNHCGSMQPDEPVYDCLNLQLKGYDFTVLESCQKEIHRYAEIMGIQVEECWATPAQQLKVQRFKPVSTAVESEYHLNVYERNVQVTDVPAWALGTLLRVSRALLPEGCTLNVHEHTPEHEEIRYVPDNELLDLKQQLDDMGGSRAEKKKKK